MAIELKDYRGRITAETDCVFEAMSRASGREKQELVREVLHEYALGKLSEHKVLAALLKREGIAGESEGSRSDKLT